MSGHIFCPLFELFFIKADVFIKFFSADDGLAAEPRITQKQQNWLEAFEIFTILFSVVGNKKKGDNIFRKQVSS